MKKWFTLCMAVLLLYQRRIRRRDHHGRDHHISLRDQVRSHYRQYGHPFTGELF